MPTSCCAYNCTERSVPGGPVSFHRFPTKNEMLFKTWCIALRRKDFHPTWASRICSKHFTKDSFDTGFKNRKLKRDAVPTIFNFGKKRFKKWTRKSLQNSTRNESYKSHSSDNEEEDYLNDPESISSSDMYSLKEIPTTVEIIKVKREISSGDGETELQHGQSQTLEGRIYGLTEDSTTFDELDSLPSKQLKNIQYENEVLRQTIFQLNEKIEEFKSLTNIIPSDDLFKDIHDDESSGSSKIYTSEEKSVEIIKIKREDSSECNAYEYHQEQLQESADGTAGDSIGFNKLVKIASMPHNQLKNLQNENEVLRKTIQDLKKMIKRIKCLAHALRSHHLIRGKTSKALKISAVA